MSTSLVISLLVSSYKPNKDRDEYLKTMSCECSLFVASSLIFLLALNKET